MPSHHPVYEPLGSARFKKKSNTAFAPIHTNNPLHGTPSGPLHASIDAFDQMVHLIQDVPHPQLHGIPSGPLHASSIKEIVDLVGAAVQDVQAAVKDFHAVQGVQAADFPAVGAPVQDVVGLEAPAHKEMAGVMEYMFGDRRLQAAVKLFQGIHIPAVGFHIPAVGAPMQDIVAAMKDFHAVQAVQASDVSHSTKELETLLNAEFGAPEPGTTEQRQILYEIMRDLYVQSAVKEFQGIHIPAVGAPMQDIVAAMKDFHAVEAVQVLQTVSAAALSHASEE